MILVRLNETGDTAEHPTPEGAVAAALELVRDVETDYCSRSRRSRNQGQTFTFRFEVDGEPIAGATAVPEHALWAVKV